MGEDTRLEKKEERLAYSLREISEQTGLSVGFLRGEEKRGRLRVRSFGRRRLVLRKDLVAYLEGSQETECEAA